MNSGYLAYCDMRKRRPLLPVWLELPEDVRAQWDLAAAEAIALEAPEPEAIPEPEAERPAQARRGQPALLDLVEGREG